MQLKQPRDPSPILAAQNSSIAGRVRRTAGDVAGAAFVPIVQLACDDMLGTFAAAR
jgi:hypothetical protein